jgi:hypothetical protein
VRTRFTASFLGRSVVLHEKDDAYTGTSIAAHGAAVAAHCLRRFGRRRLIYRNVAGIWREVRQDGSHFLDAVDLAADELEVILEECGLEL